MNSRLETFCDGVFAIAITLLILEIKVPDLAGIHSVKDVWIEIGRLWPSFFALGLSFVIIFIAWVAHHNFLKLVRESTPQFMFANGFFLFTVIFIPFPTSFMAEYLNTPYAQPAVVFYSFNALLHNVGWIVLARSIVKPVNIVKKGAEYKAGAAKVIHDSQFAFFIYLVLMVMAWWLPYVSLTISVLIWLYWLYLSVAIRPKEEVRVED